MIKRLQVLPLLFAIVCIFLLTSCIDDNYNFDNISTTVGVDMTLVAPLAHSNVPLSELIPDSVDEYHVNVVDDKIFFSYEEVRNLGNEIINHIKMLPKGDFTFYLPPVVSDPHTGTIDQVETLTFNGINTNPNERLDSMLLKGQILPLTIETSDDWVDPSYIELSFNDNEFILDADLYPGNKVIVPLTQGQTHVNIDISRSVLILNGTDRIHLNIKAGLKSDPSSEISGNSIVVKLSYDYLEPHLTYCNLGPGRSLFNTEQVIHMDFFSKLDDAFFPFYNPEFFIIAENNIGLPVDYKIEYVKAEDPDTGEEVFADFHGSPSTVFELAYPLYAPIAGLSHRELMQFDTHSIIESSSFLLDRDNGATNRLFQINVKSLSYKYSIWPRPSNPTDVHYFFQESDIRLKLRYQFQWYFEGNETDSTKNFRLAAHDTIDLEIGRISPDPLQVDEEFVSQIKLNYINNLPIGAHANLLFLDEDGNEVLPELAKQYFIPAAQVDENGLVIPSTDPDALIYIRMNYSQFVVLTEDVRQIAFTYALGNDKLEDIQFKASDWLDLTASMYAKGDVAIDINDAY